MNPEYPPEIGFLIKTLLEKHELREPPEKMLEKIKKGEMPRGRIIAEIIREIVEEKKPVENLTQMLQERLGIEKEKAEKLAKDIKEEILTQIGIVKPSPLKPKIPKIEPKISEPKPTSFDIYREPIE